MQIIEILTKFPNALIKQQIDANSKIFSLYFSITYVSERLVISGYSEKLSKKRDARLDVS